jgi:hypothetical protein
LETDNTLKESKVDLVNFGFETSLEQLQQRRSMFNPEALILAPISSNPEGSLEQMYSLLEFRGEMFNSVSEIMKTSFSLRVDKQREINQSLD